MVGIGLEAASLRKGRDNGLPASMTLLVFHELVESYHRTHEGRQYAPAHAAAIRAEERLRAQRPEFAGFAFGAGPYIRDIRDIRRVP